MRAHKLALVMASLLAMSAGALALGDPLVSYFGAWVGKTVTVDKGFERPLSARDIDLTIRQTRNGFDMLGKILTRSGAKRVSISFVAASGSGTYEVRDANPPLNGNTRARARMEDGKLVVYIAELDDQGAERVSRYERSVAGDEMTFRYTLSDKGEVVQSVTGSLVRITL